MGVASLLAPFVAKRLLDPVTPGLGRHAKVLMGGAVAASALTTAADVVRRRRAEGGLPCAGTLPAGDPRAPRTGPDAVPHLRDAPLGRRVTGAMAAAAVASTALTVATTWSAQTSGTRLFGLTGRDLGTGVAANAVAILGWDAIYYWNHRLNHESRWLWAMHVVNHSSERDNLSTALRQPVAKGLTMSVPYGLLALAGVRPSVHHGTSRQCLDRNHGSILIVWDRLFGTFEREDEWVVYGLTTNIDTSHPATIATQEWRGIGRDVAGAASWRERWSFLLRGPGWAHDRRAELLGRADAKDLAAA